MKNILNILKNKYIIATVVFVVWVGFIDRNNLIHIWKTRKELNSLLRDKEYYLNEIKETRRIQNEILYNQKTLEKFARERYFMKRDGEDVFIVDEQDVN